MKNEFLAKLKTWANTDYMEAKIVHGFAGRSDIGDKYPCANPDGPVDNSDCPEEDPYCHCPCQELRPDSDEQLARINAAINGADENGDPIQSTVIPEHLKEPTDEEMKRAQENMSECPYIIDALDAVNEGGEDWLGCLWDNQDHPSSCDCPCVGSRFNEYLEYTRTYATYWDTPSNTPLWRNAQMRLIGSQSAVIVLNGDLSLKPGTIIRINDPDNVESDDDKSKNYTGKWLVTAVEHIIGIRSHRCLVNLSRDSVNYNIEKSYTNWEDSQSTFKSAF